MDLLRRDFSSFVILFLVWILGAGVCCGPVFGEELYVKKDTWAETMVASRAQYAAMAKQWQDGMHAIKLGSWYQAGPLSVELFADAMFPEEKVDLNAKAEDGTRLWEGHPEYIDGEIHHFEPKDPASTYLFRTITAAEPIKVTAGLGSNDGLAVWLNGEQLHAQDTGRRVTAEQDHLILDLKQGENQLLLKIFNHAGPTGFYFLIHPGVFLGLWEQIEKDFPQETAWIKRELPENQHLNWLRQTNDVKLEKKIISAMLEKLAPADDRLKKEFESLSAEQASANDGRWLELYIEGCRLHESLTNLKQFDFAALRGVTEYLQEISPQSYAGQAEDLKRLRHFEQRIPEIKKSLAQFNELSPHQVEKIDGFVQEVQDTMREIYAQRCPPIVFVKRQAHARKGTNGTMLGQMNLGAKMGSEICIYDPTRPDRGVKTIFKDTDGFIFDMNLSYDARKLVFSFMDNVKENANTQNDSFHIWEINTDGTGLRQLTHGPFHDASAVYMPDGRIVFCSTRVQSFSLCQDFLAAAMFIMDADGGDIRRLEYNSLCNTTPFVMDDGLILFTRWEYQDKNIFCVQGLWTITPAGERLQLYHGNTLTIPNSVCNAKPIPGTRKVLCTMAPHHGRPLGAIAVIDRSKGFETPESIVNITPEIPYQPRLGESWNYGPNRSWGPGDVQFRWAFGDPYPLAEDLFLVSYGGPLKGGPERYRIFLLDNNGNKVQLYDDPATSCFNPIPLRARPLPHKLPGTIPEPQGEGTYFVADIYRGLLQKGVKRGQIKQLRIMSQVPKKYNTEGPRYHDHYPIVGQGSYYVKYCYGTVPVHEDGTAYFKVPAGVELYFIALDENGKEIRRMGTITQITAGERQSCVGCHESRFLAAPPRTNAMQRLRRKPDSITPPPWGEGTVDYVKLVQPILDKHCTQCHSGRSPKARADMSGDKSRFYNMSYRTLVDRNLVAYYYINTAPTGNFPPMASGSWVSKLTKMIESEHGGVKMDDASRRKIYAWIDSNAPYYSTWDMSRPYTQGGRDTWNRIVEGRGKNAKREPESWFAEFQEIFKPKCSSCHDLKPDWINLTNPQYSRVLNAHLGADAGGMALKGQTEDKVAPLFADTTDETYQAMLKALEGGRDALAARPRVDMPGAIRIAQQRNFGKIY